MTISNASVCRISVSCFVPIPTTITFGAGDEERWLRVDSRRVREDSSSLDRRHSGVGLGVGCQSGSWHRPGRAREAPQVQPSRRQRRGDPERHRSHSRSAQSASRRIPGTPRGTGPSQSVPNATIEAVRRLHALDGLTDPFDTDLVVPFPLEETQESSATA